MELPLQITHRNMDASPAIDGAIRKQVKHLESIYQRIIACRVLVEAPHRHHRRGQLFHVRIDITVPGTELVVGRDPAKCGQHKDFHVALRDAFRAARRELTSYAEKQRIHVKRHIPQSRGLVTNILRGNGYGFLRAVDGHTVYFHANSVVGGLDQVEAGMIVSYIEEPGDKGPQATVVKKVGWARPSSGIPRSI